MPVPSRQYNISPIHALGLEKRRFNHRYAIIDVGLS